MEINTRKSVVIHEDDHAYTFLKPLSDEWNQSLLCITEDAYGCYSEMMMNYKDIIIAFELTLENFRKIIYGLDIKEDERVLYYERFCNASDPYVGVYDKVLEILDKYKLDESTCILNSTDGVTPVIYYNAYEFSLTPLGQKYFHTNKTDDYFDFKYENNTASDDCFILGSPIFPQWCEAIDEIIDLCRSIDPMLIINKAKIKHGSVRLYMSSSVIHDLKQVSALIRLKLYHKSLIF